jgi:predicted PurR-regulated permease PerM
MDGAPPSPAHPAGLRNSPTLRPLRPLIVFGAVVLVTASLYWARDVLIPIALATLLTFLLNPVANTIQRWGLGRTASVVMVVALAFSLIAGAGWALTQQVSTLGNDVPTYTAAIKEKVARWRREGGGRVFGRVQSGVDDVVGEIQKSVPTREKPVPVIVQGEQTSLLSRVTAVLEPLATAGLVALLVVFMLFERVELRNRLIRLFGYGRLTITTKALDEAAERISGYLLGQSIVNVSFGLAFGVGLYFIGLPYALVWGALLTVLRYIPYVGVWLAVLPPILFSLAVFDGWTKPLYIALLFIVLELIVSVGIEPVVYSQRAGVSKVALLAAVAVWTWLWGPVGLLLATPLTACLLVLAKYVPEMEFVAIMVGDEPALAAPVSYYQRLLAEDQDEAREIVEKFLETHPVERVYDDLLIPALVAAKRDFARHRLSEDGLEFVVHATAEIIQDLLPREATDMGAGAAEGTAAPEGAVAPGGPAAPEPEARARVLGCPVRDTADELALAMFNQLVDPTRLDVEMTSAEVLTSEVVALVETSRPAVICLSVLPPGGLAQARYLCKRLRARYPKIKILVGRWGYRGDGEENWDVLLSAGADHVSGSLLETRDHLAAVATLQPAAAPPTAAAALA